MSERYKSLTVALEKDMRDDDAQELIQAIKMLRGVLDVRGDVALPDQWIEDERARRSLAGKLFAVIYDDKKKGGEQ